ncbi:hypothetical protein [Myxococcus landrumensis]|uniref:Uncharacterized protein n=1 Tax=Myxococcus landrumensis TaxID=2813577 RepID=A0ABX7NEA7_9BACT|nr:hypothetical protein [Myxococcus landrumus]QSQ15922.1 hypothetical protein JY572_07680 [Myxococcus landrumus]
MLIFLRSSADTNAVITTALDEVTVASYTTQYPPLANAVRTVIPWYAIDADPMDFGRRLLRVAAADRVCRALLSRATTTWGVDFSIRDDAFVTADVQKHYVKQLKIWLSPLSGNLGSRDAHRDTVDAQYARLWSTYGLSQATLRLLAASDFFKELNVAGRRDRIQIYRNVVEAARALVGEVTSWPSRTIEKIAVLSLLRSPGLAAHQLQMLEVVATAFRTNTLVPDHTKWEYLPYYLRGAPLETVAADVAGPRVLGAIHDALDDSAATRASVDRAAVNTFKGLAAGAEYRRWRMLPPVVRYQVLISDLARILPGGKQESRHWRVEFGAARLDGLPDNLGGYGGWAAGMTEHASATPHNPGKAFPFAAGWTRNELCPNVVSSRLMLAPLYAGTSGHNQGRILAWRALVPTLPALANIPLGLVISAGYSVLWRLYYDKRVSGFHTLFETFQGTHVDTTVRNLGGVPRPPEDAVWSAVLATSLTGTTDVRAFWSECVRLFGKRGPSFHRELKAATAAARRAALEACPGAVIPRWNTTGEVDRTAPEVDVWTPEQNAAVLREYAEWRRLAENPPVPKDVSGSVMSSLVLFKPEQVPELSAKDRLQFQVDIAAVLGVDQYMGDPVMKKLFNKWLVKNASDKTTDMEEREKRDEQVKHIRWMFDKLASDGSGPRRMIMGPVVQAASSMALNPDEVD